MTPEASIFLSHNYRDKPFVRTLAQDLSAMGVRVWLDEAELKVGDSLITRNNDYLCVECGSVRPFAGNSATVVICPDLRGGQPRCGKVLRMVWNDHSSHLWTELDISMPVRLGPRRRMPLLIWRSQERAGWRPHAGCSWA